MKNIKSLGVIALSFLFTLTSCGQTGVKVNPDKEHYVVGISQFAVHNALDEATRGFKEALTAELGSAGRTVEFKEHNAQGEVANTSIIASTLVASDVDLILANATPSLQSACTATSYIPILGTSVTEYGTALNIKDFNGVVGGNVSGTSDLAPLDGQVEMLLDLVPTAEKIGLLYCSSEPNSEYQVKVVEELLKEKGKDVKRYKFTDSNDIYNVALNASLNSDAIYVPTDNTAASNALLIDSACRNETKKTPVICGEENSAKACGIAALSISYYDLGVKTGEMAADVLLGEKDISTLEIAYSSIVSKKYNSEIAEDLNISIPEDYVAII